MKRFFSLRSEKEATDNRQPLYSFNSIMYTIFLTPIRLSPAG